MCDSAHLINESPIFIYRKMDGCSQQYLVYVLRSAAYLNADLISYYEMLLAD